MKRLVALLIAVWVMAAHPASGHTRSESHSDWTIDAKNVVLTFTFADAEAQRVSRSGFPSDVEMLTYLQRRVGVRAADVSCPVVGSPRPLLAAPGFRRFELAFRCADAGHMVLHDTAFFDVVPSHVNLAQVQTSKGEFVQQLITADHPDLVIDGIGGHGLENAGFFQFVAMGNMHIFTGIDHMSFLVGLVLISRRLRDLVFVVSGFTIGHSLTLALAVTGVLRPHAEFIDALVALTIALIGAENAAVATHRPWAVALTTGGALTVMTGLRLGGLGLLPPALLGGAALFSASYLIISGEMKEAGRLRLVVALVFGLIHGFGFAADLLQSRIPPMRLAELLFGFNLGVEVGQLTLVLSLAGIVWLLGRQGWALPRRLTVDATSSGLIGLGTFWFISRSF